MRDKKEEVELLSGREKKSEKQIEDSKDEAAAKQKEAKSRWGMAGGWVGGGGGGVSTSLRKRKLVERVKLSDSRLTEKERERGAGASMKQSLFFILHICT